MAIEARSRRGPIALSEERLREAKPEAKRYELTDAPKRGEGALLVRVEPSGRKDFYFRYFVKGKAFFIKIGRFREKKNDGGLTLEDARKKAATHTAILREHGDPKLKALEQERANEQQRRELEFQKKQGTLNQLIDAYIRSLKSKGKPEAAHDTEITLALHVTEAHPKIATAKAKDVAPDDITTILATMLGNGITRRANIVRAMLHAAFAYGAKCELNPLHVAADGVAFGIQSNPVALVPLQDQFDRVGKRVLTDEELGALWNGVQDRPSHLRAALRLAILFGGQRITQLTRAKWHDYDRTKHVLTLIDSKGRGPERTHLLPISEWARSILTDIKEGDGDNYIFATRRHTRVTVEQLSAIVREFVKKNGIAHYRLGDLRRTAETRIASLGVKKDIRAQLLSHGRTGVQDTHYDQWEYLPEKVDALAKWEAYLKAVLDRPA
ncbi:tyrosine-type recombinase/integrase [Noviherbaspirillum malthae]|uniref:tyrosine-type recombinase/integrase n=1 Tax=Noviherbaspirillum malthae TaxID=1260987 RepID=UPI00188F3B6E|nr:integrase family protein [Noviherbaspirillum malthae]